MAVVLDYGVLANFSSFFVWLLIFLLGYGLLKMTDILGLGKDSSIYAVIAFVLAFLLLLSEEFIAVLTYALPWISILILIAFFLLFFAKIFNPGMDSTGVMKDGTVRGLTIAFTAIIFLFAFSNAIGDDVLQAQTGIDTSQLSEAEIAAGEVIPADTFVPVEGNARIAGAGSAATLDRRTNIINTIFHPNVLGMLFLLFAAMTTVYLIAR